MIRTEYTVTVNGENYIFDGFHDGNKAVLTAIVLSLYALNNKDVNRIFRECQMILRDKNGKEIRFDAQPQSDKGGKE